MKKYILNGNEIIRIIIISAFAGSILTAICFNTNVCKTDSLEKEDWQCIEWKNKTYYQNYGEAELPPTYCIPTGGCGAPAGGDVTCGYMCTRQVCTLEGKDCKEEQILASRDSEGIVCYETKTVCSETRAYSGN